MNLRLLAIVLVALPIFARAATPVISEISRDIIANVGEDVEFNCTVQNIGRLSVSWAKQGSESVVLTIRHILSLSDPRYSVTETKDEQAGTVTYAFKITNIEASDMGPYECQVIISPTDKLSKKLNLSIRHPPIIDVKHMPKTVTVTEGQKLEVSCHAIGFPQPVISWSRVGNAIMPAGGNVLAGPTLQVESTHRLDRGGYYCIADNGVDKAARRLVHVEVEFRPQIVVHRPKMAQMLDHVADLECSVQAYPAPSIVWYRNSTKLQSDYHHEISTTATSHESTTSVLFIASVDESDFGDYFCKATNKLGHAESRLHLFRWVIGVPNNH